MSQHYDALMSYTRFDDESNAGYLTEFCTRLSREVQIHTGKTFRIFQDVKDIAWGEQFEQRIDYALDTITFFIPILTPSFFASDFCRYELEKFLSREHEPGHRNLVLPVYYIRVPEFEDETLHANDSLMQRIANRKYIDWRKLRFKPFTDPAAREMLAQMAEQIAEALYTRPHPAIQPDIPPPPQPTGLDPLQVVTTERDLFSGAIDYISNNKVGVIRIFAPVALWQDSDIKLKWMEELGRALEQSHEQPPRVQELRAIYGLPPEKQMFQDVMVKSLKPLKGKNAARIRYIDHQVACLAPFPGCGILIMGDDIVSW
jgi:hypothetical protein